MVRQRKYRSNQGHYFCSCNGIALFLLGIASFTTLINVYLGIISKETTKLLKQNKLIYLDKQHGQLRRLIDTTWPRAKRTPGLNRHTWFELCFNSTLDLCRYPMFPYAPNSRDTITSTRINRRSKQFVQRVFGFLEPPTTGAYQFKLSAKDSTELWLSSDNKLENAVPIARVIRNITKPSPYGSRTQISEKINLKEGKQYFIDIINMQSQQDGYLNVQWKLPQSDSFKIINSSCLFLFLNETDEGYNKWRFDSKIPECVVCQKKQNKTWNKHFLLDRFLYLKHAEVANVLPYCSYKPSYAIPGRKVKQWEAISSSQITIHTYTNPLTEFNGIKDHDGWKFEVSKVQLENIVAMYIYRLHKNLPGRFKLHSVRKVERKNDSSGSRFLLDLELERIKTKEIVLLSEYIYFFKDNGSLCYPKGLQWNRTADIYFVVTAKNQGPWIQHLFGNMERIYRETRDKHFNLVIFDYNSTDINLEYAVNETLFSKISFVRKAGKFVKTHAYNEAVKTVKDPNAVIFLLDLHYEISSNLITDIRKHVVSGKMVYTPIIVRMDCGFLPSSPRGNWENCGFGPIAIYKSDWVRIGGFIKHRLGWGGEDWDLIDQVVAKGLEYERLRTPYMYHYFHSHKRMWKV